ARALSLFQCSTRPVVGVLHFYLTRVHRHLHSFPTRRSSDLRFIRESRAAAAVDAPHIIPVFEAGEASGVLFIAMRFVRGGDVRSLVGQFGPMPPGRVAEIVSQVASALDAAHSRGLVHRDVKPANMLLDASSGAG